MTGDQETCLLCGAGLETYNDLCDACNRVFVDTAARVGRAFGQPIRYRDHCVVCGRTVTGDSPADLLAGMVEHYDGHVDA